VFFCCIRLSLCVYVRGKKPENEISLKKGKCGVLVMIRANLVLDRGLTRD
jgi:hypothetical protein